MLADLTPEQRARLARGWVWQVGHLPARCKARITIVEPKGDICVDDPERDIWFAKDELVPDLTDPVTADGLLRTARAVLKIPSLAAVVYSENDGKPDLWALQRFCFYFGPDHELLTSEGWGGPSTKTMLWKSEPAALLAAILAAPEAQ